MGVASNNQIDITDRAKLLAWSVHLFTASGAVWGMLSILAIFEGNWPLAFVWMGAAIVVDSLDGFLARKAHVKTVLPEFDGALLDNMVDYLNYVLVPAIFLSQSHVLPDVLPLLGPAAILLASAYQFCQTNAKTADHFFVGFPSYWNVVVFYLLLVNINPWISLAIILVLCALVFVPFKYIYPTRTVRFQRLTLAVIGIWGLANLILLIQYPTVNFQLIAISLACGVYYWGMSLFLMFDDRKRSAA
ncbi:MAG: CDP-alcohol phosphatidyltransferase family protein [Caldilineaceae bacterium]|nr:CDP-alcohol phosphatidyltransferase family protein [Caldilineaceae bacterium]MBP8110337.1 CDP-alcohol phosphatidyltransferase family protein [Caldilineaceae bacterium]